MGTEIRVPHTVRAAWVKAGVWTYPTIRKALRGEVDNELMRQIRKAAMESGGREYKIIDN